ncbi:related to Protein FYV4, mitochondrial [Saccharomycodes ludwigii]|uniref:Small ribosomal subunit protein mS41 n=1 Tax=Saccharomycodes ludwigii TaxID=36035 RepID=A0A376B7D4_9ASCO|nr:hypothetical protein SCDLUD_004635 [Saccharomycodes ludwigii]KAH3899204.1 hypothetical protein SCDLUD_004635 [Saccharomycodes ludwigii]SSD60489.1 related to Protein FYV4, mitochondrial [Saccharomycodes ludwigii]
MSMFCRRGFHTSPIFNKTFSSVSTKLASYKPIPKPTKEIADIPTFLKKIGRGCQEFEPIYENKWENLFTFNTKVLKEKGVSIQQRKYIASQLERFRKSHTVNEIKLGKKSFFGSERHRAENIAKWRIEQRNKNK